MGSELKSANKMTGVIAIVRGIMSLLCSHCIHFIPLYAIFPQRVEGCSNVSANTIQTGPKDPAYV